MMSMADLRECYQRNPEALGIALVERLERTVTGAFCWAKWWQGLAYLVLSRTVDGGWECGEGDLGGIGNSGDGV